ncbi:MAG TPA: cytochrome c oxidase subunit 3 [Steroidobacteraceae bacterium]|jgi:nitric oxide reductase NorE protein|nr:cytochrome c oxidase subunit 3 [Steroidobacteraceae bacterium]
MSGRTDVRQLPGETGIWVFILTDLLLFGLYFVLAQCDHVRAPWAFQAGKAELSIALGTANTLLLLAGSWAVAMGTRVVQDARQAGRCLGLAAFSGVLFLALKAFEWHRHLSQGHRIDENPFQTWYFFLTGFHALHVIGATLWLAALARRLTAGRASSTVVMEAAGCYWHLVDLLWIGIFLVIYVL